ncbi:DUF5672 family protein [Sphingomonas montana]|uniref:DUF5672 family protein n=1 Tax=Sphingomonas montana TaxID=1843236 RepID=UPI0023E443FA|nr:DUF5672 family protein [Sphingomonas montana]
MTRLELPNVTLCAVTSVNVSATLRALEFCLDQVAFADCLLLTDADVQPSRPDMRIVPIDRLASSAAYSTFMMSRLVDHVDTTHCLVTQWDGHLLNAERWRQEYLDYDYIGASWPQFTDGHDVGNGGFSLRSRRLMEACRAPQFRMLHPEDIAIGRTNREWLEGIGMRFAPRAIADAFAVERTGNLETAFGYHGVFNMPRAIGVDAFWQVYRTLDDRRTLGPDFGAVLRVLARGRGGTARALQMIKDRARGAPRG